MKTRFCPSPTGLIHLGNARTALFSLLAAKAAGGHFLLRMEDTDQERSTVHFAEQLQTDLHWLGIQWDEGVNSKGDAGPYWQSQRQTVYDHYYQILEEQGFAYPCFCSEQELALQRKVLQSSGLPPRYSGKCRDLTATQIAEKKQIGLKPTLRFRLPVGEKIIFNDLVKGEQVFQSDDIGDFIIRRGDNTAPFLFCNAIDDSLMGVTHALRGDDHLANTPRQLLILRALKMPAPQYGHLSLILGSDGSPLSKRNGSRSIEEMRVAGFLPEAIQNYLARLGHYYAINDFMSLDELSIHFAYQNLGRAPARFDYEQLLHWQKLALQKASTERIASWLGESLQQAVPVDKLDQFIQLIKPNIVFPHEVNDWAKIFFTTPTAFSAENKAILKRVGTTFFKLATEHWAECQGNIQNLCNYLKTELGVKGKELFQPLRVALSHNLHGPEMQGIVDLLGVTEVHKRLQQAADSID